MDNFFQNLSSQFNNFKQKAADTIVNLPDLDIGFKKYQVRDNQQKVESQHNKFIESIKNTPQLALQHSLRTNPIVLTANFLGRARNIQLPQVDMSGLSDKFNEFKTKSNEAIQDDLEDMEFARSQGVYAIGMPEPLLPALLRESQYKDSFVGKALINIFGESDTIKQAREKIENREPLTKEEAQALNQQTYDIVLGMATPVKAVGKSKATVEVAEEGAKRIGGINVKNANLSKTGEEVIEEFKPILEKIKGKTLTHEEVITDAVKRGELLEGIVTRDQTVKLESQMLNSRNKLVELDKLMEGAKTATEREAVLREFLGESKKVSSTASSWGRMLESMKIKPEQQNLRQRILKEIANKSDALDDVAKKASKVNWENQDEVTKFYREFVKPSGWDVLNEMRYNNMLSSPKSHLRNFFGNAFQTTVVRPATKLFSGDVVGTGKYYKGLVQGLGGASDDFTKAYKGDLTVLKPDVDFLPTGKLPSQYRIPTRLMEASDRFFSRMIREGELAAGKTAKEADEIASYSLFRNILDPSNKTGQGKILSAIDDGIARSEYLRGTKLGRLFVPFYQTPMRIAKMGIEYSPAGYSTMWGASGPRVKEQFAKASIGSLLTLWGLNKAGKGELTWKPPKDAKAREAFYASGRKPFSVKVGNTWVPINYLGPLATSMGIAGAWHYNAVESPDAPTDSDLDKFGKTLIGVTRTWVQQTPFAQMQGILEFLTQDNPDASIGNIAGFTTSSYIPMTGLLRYISQIVDPVYRKSSGFGATIQAGIPFASKNNEAYTDPFGQPSTREGINAVLPYDVGIQRNNQKANLIENKYQDRLNQLQQNATKRDVEKRIESGGDVNANEWATFFGVNDIIDMPEGTLLEKVQKRKSALKAVKDIESQTGVTQEQKNSLYESLGINPQEAKYYSYATMSEDERVALVVDSVQKSKNPMQLLLALRTRVDDEQILSPGVITKLEKAGVITEDQADYLKKVELQDGKPIFTGKSKGVSKPPAAKRASVSAPVSLSRPNVNVSTAVEPITRRSVTPSTSRGQIRLRELPRLETPQELNALGRQIGGLRYR